MSSFFNEVNNPGNKTVLHSLHCRTVFLNQIVYRLEEQICSYRSRSLHITYILQNICTQRRYYLISLKKWDVTY